MKEQIDELCNENASAKAAKGGAQRRYADLSHRVAVATLAQALAMGSFGPAATRAYAEDALGTSVAEKLVADEDLQAYLSTEDWKVVEGDAAQESRLHDFDEMAAAAEGLRDFCCEVPTSMSGTRYIIDDMACTLDFGPTASMHVKFKVVSWRAHDLSATFAGRDVPCRLQEDGYWHADIYGIAPSELGEKLVVEGTFGASAWTSSRFEASIAPLAFANDLMSGEGANDTTRDVAAALYWLWRAA